MDIFMPMMGVYMEKMGTLPEWIMMAEMELMNDPAALEIRKVEEQTMWYDAGGFFDQSDVDGNGYLNRDEFWNCFMMDETEK